MRGNSLPKLEACPATELSYHCVAKQSLSVRIILAGDYIAHIYACLKRWMMNTLPLLRELNWCVSDILQKSKANA